MAMTGASSPGKVLILGGYIIVEGHNVGISIGTTARFETRVVSEQNSPDEKCRVQFFSPQFKKEYIFECTVKDGAEPIVLVTQIEGSSSPFLYYSVLYAVAAVVSQGGDIRKTVTLELLADNDFYSQRNYLEAEGRQVTVANLRTLPHHLPLVGDVSKTGLGSSAAMTTSAVACLYSFLRSIDFNDSKELELIHRTAQIAHSVAQGKIGSGFDVYTATYGTCLYRRFPAQCIEKIMNGTEPPKSVGVINFSDCINLEKEWVERVPFRLPLGLKLVLGDVHQGGTGTPGMVSKVMAWRKSVANNPESLWNLLSENNENYVKSLRLLISDAEEKPKQYMDAVETLKHVVIAQHTPKNESERLWIEAATLASKSRRYLREMGHAASVEIEPNVLSTLLDATFAIPGVFAVGCPGAGGYDAVFALVIGDETCAVIEEFWERYENIHICPLMVREDAKGLIFS
ncbi:GHMP kinase [Trypanosoma melophagium]|uniref:GHMP kinase n=1 Tax=Trypanosoma melophagium TaxID=715481 RepID=UPI00351A36DD|nr:GHMP kinase [Trypanosoma melophagium]